MNTLYTFSLTNYGLNFKILARILRVLAHAGAVCELLKNKNVA